MADGKTKPVIFISYSHKDEPDHPRDDEVAWLSFVREYLQPAVKHGVFELWDDRSLEGGADWDPEIERKLRECDIFILLVSPRSMASHYVVDREIAAIRERQAAGEDVHFYPLLLTPTPKAGLDKVKDKNLRPRDAKPFSGFPPHDRMQHMSDAADEIAVIAERIGERKSKAAPVLSRVRPAYVHTAGLPETPYERLVGRDRELRRLDDAWTDTKTAILSLIAEGGAGKTALVNEWLKRMQADDYRGADTVLGWSFYSQGTKERATSADAFLNWAVEKLGIRLDTTSATAKGDAIAEALVKRRALLVLDGVEPLQHGPDGQSGQLKDPALRALLRRAAAAAREQSYGLIVLTSRLPVPDIYLWRDASAPVLDVEKLSDEAGAALVRDNGAWGTDGELRNASRAFGGHPLALGLLASLLKETQSGDIRKRDHIRAFLADKEDPRHDHAVRVMESFEKQWLTGQPVLLAIMHIVGLFDRPADNGCINALRRVAPILNLTDEIVGLSDENWNRAINRLREVRLLLPPDPADPSSLDAHPLVREWFGSRLRQTNENAWKSAHGNLYEYLRDATKEGDRSTLEQLAPLYQAVAHGCRADRHQEALYAIFVNRICTRYDNGTVVLYASTVLGAHGSDLAALSWFFDKPFTFPVRSLRDSDRGWLLGSTNFCLRALGRFAEASAAMRAGLKITIGEQQWGNAAISAINLSETELMVGEISEAIETAKTSILYADRFDEYFHIVYAWSTLADATHAIGRYAEAERLFADAEKRQKRGSRAHPLLYGFQGYRYCDLLLSAGKYTDVRKRAYKTLEWSRPRNYLLDIALDTLGFARAHFGIAIAGSNSARRGSAKIACNWFEEAVERLRAAGRLDDLPRGLFARAAFRRCVGDFGGAKRDLDEVEEIAEPGLMRLFLCDLALERARLAFAQIESFAPLNGMIDNSPPKPGVPGAEIRKELHEEAGKQITIAAKLIADCGYHRRDTELAELQSVPNGELAFVYLPTHV
jgi:tetratricopeptide (TPR) repeat protein